MHPEIVCSDAPLEEIDALKKCRRAVEMAVKVGINGFGRIGRNIYRTSIGDPDIDFVAVNDLTDTKTLAHLLKYDSVLGNLDHEISSTDNGIKVDADEFRVFSQRDPAQIDWESVGAENRDRVYRNLYQRLRTQRTPARQRKESDYFAPAKDEDITIVLGVNEGQYDHASHHIISNASCTTNCLAPVAK